MKGTAKKRNMEHSNRKSGGKFAGFKRNSDVWIERRKNGKQGFTSIRDEHSDLLA